MLLVDDASPSRENLLWEPDLVPHFFARDGVYVRIRERSRTGTPTLSAQAYADVVTRLRLRSLSPDKIAVSQEELLEFNVVPLDRVAADVFATSYGACLASARNRGLDVPETWFVWQVALHRLHGCRVLTNDRARYAGLVASDDLV